MGGKWGKMEGKWGNSEHGTWDVDCGGLWRDVIEKKETKMREEWEKNARKLGRNTHFL